MIFMQGQEMLICLNGGELTASRTSALMKEILPGGHSLPSAEAAPMHSWTGDLVTLQLLAKGRPAT
jgi:hypothetical protein